MGPNGNWVRCVAPTITLTELGTATWSDPAKADRIMVSHPIARFAEAAEVATSVAMLLPYDTA